MTFSNTDQNSDQTRIGEPTTRLIMRWAIIIFLVIISVMLKYKWRRIIHIIAGFTWYGLVFFLVIVLLPIIDDLSDESKYEITGKLFPRVFRTASVVAFFTVVIGWYNFTTIYPNFTFSEFVTNVNDILFLIAITLISLLFLFHTFLERKEIKVIENASRTGDYSKVDELMNNLKVIPKVGLLIMIFSVIMMFIH